MKINYFKMMLALGAVAMAGTAMAEDGAWHNINYKLQNPAFIPGWSGALTATDWGVGECYNGAFEIYQVLPDMPAGTYTLTANAFHRPGWKNDSQDVRTFIFVNEKEKKVHPKDNGGDDVWSLEMANAAFEANRYVNVLTVNHEGGDLKLGIRNYGTSADEWVAFDNFQLLNEDGEYVEIPNGDFSEGLNPKAAAWDIHNKDNAEKAADTNKGGGVYRKTNASIYNFGQRVELPAGLYRWGVQSFHRDGASGNLEGAWVPCKGSWNLNEGESALDRHLAGNHPEANNVYLYVTSGWDTDDNGNLCKPTLKEWALDEEFGNPDGFWNETPIMCLWDEELDVYPDNLNAFEGDNEDGYGWWDSGWEYQAARTFVANPDLYRNYVEFELTEPTAVWVGLKKDVNPGNQFWNPFRDFTLEAWEAETGVASVAAQNNTIEYFNLQGVRVANPAEGIFIVREGNKVSKKVF